MSPYTPPRQRALAPKLSVVVLIVVVSWTCGGRCGASENDNWWDGFAAPPNGKGLNSIAYDMTVHDGVLYVGGFFTQAGNNTNAKRIGRWSGSGWTALQGGMDANVNTLLSRGADLYVGGAFLQAGFTSANYVACWSSSIWSAMGSGMNDHVAELATFGSDIVAGGWFTEAEGQPCGLVARWDGASWSPLGLGMGGPGPPGSVVRELVEFDGFLYAGGIFTTADGLPVTHLARWDGSQWSDFGAHLDGWVRMLSVVDGMGLLVGGSFSSINGITCNGLACWDGSTWTGLGLGLGPAVEVVDVDIYNGALIALGHFDLPGGTSDIARWSGSSWLRLGSGLMPQNPNGGPGALVVFGGSLYACGNIWQAGGKPSSYIARWTSIPTGVDEALSPMSGWHVSVAGNPAVSEATIAYSVGSFASVSLDIHDVQGRLIRNLVSGSLTPGSYVFSWKGDHSNGARAPSGVYFAQLLGNGTLVGSSKFVLLR